MKVLHTSKGLGWSLLYDSRKISLRVLILVVLRHFTVH